MSRGRREGGEAPSVRLTTTGRFRGAEGAGDFLFGCLFLKGCCPLLIIAHQGAMLRERKQQGGNSIRALNTLAR